MVFRNENTFRLGSDLIDRHFDRAAQTVRRGLGKRHPMYIAGKKVFSEEEVETYSPSDREIVIGSFQKGTADHARDAVLDADEAFRFAWRSCDWKDRVRIMMAAARIMSEKKFELAALISYENGKTRNESIGEVDEAIDFLRFYCQLVEQNQGLIINRRFPVPRRKVGDFGHQGARSIGERIKIVSKPFGVWGVIAPFNFPLSISTGMCAAAMITGNTVVFKPSFGDNPTPLTGIRMYQVFAVAGLPDGVLNCITGSGSEVGNELVENDSVKGLAFTGSREVGLRMQRRAVDHSIPKQFVAEMGSKNPVIVTATADLDKAVTGVAHAAFGYAGQKCSASSRALVHESVYDIFLNRLTRLVKELKVGDPLRRETYVGPLVGRAAFERYVASMDKARAEGRIIWGGSPLRGEMPFDSGYYVEPAIIEVDQRSELFRRELFLPILAVVRFKGFEEAIELANDTEYGLTAGLYTGDQEEIDYFNNNIEFGTTYVNRDVSATTGAIVGQQSFVGFKGSSVRCKGTSSLSYLHEFVREHSQTVVQKA